MKNNTIKYLTLSAVIAALYCAVTIIVAPLSYGAIQIRISEALTILPAICPPAICGLTLGCFLSNLIGFFMGANMLGLIDCVIGTAATFLAALLTYYIGKHFKGKWVYILAPLPPVLLNGIFIGAEIAYVIMGDFTAFNFLASGGYVALGQILPCYLGGAILLSSTKKYFEKFF